MTPLIRSPRRALQAALLVMLTAAGVLHPVPALATQAVMGVDTEPLARSAFHAASSARVDTVREAIDEFRLFGVTWAGDEAHGRVRFHTSRGWGRWQEIEADSDDGPDKGSREAGGRTAWTKPIWVGRADGYQLELPAGADDVAVHLVRERGRQVRIRSGAPAAGAATDAPPITGRAAWGARAPKVAPTYNSGLKLGFVHHTVSSNSYAQGDVPSMLRAIQAYHMDTNGWDDIGYNFLVDRFGGLWEGREGGITKVVKGAHAAGFNTSTTGVAVLGDFTTAAPSSAAVQGAARILGWKLPLHGVDPLESVQYTSEGSNKYPAGTVVTLANISGHRDAVSTTCPGQPLYDQLPTIRSAAAGWAGIVSAYPGFTKGVFVGAGQFTGGGNSEIVTGADAGGGPHVRTFNANGTPRGSFFPYPSAFGGGVRVAAGNVDALGDDEIVTGAGPGGGPHVRALRENGEGVLSLFAYDPAFRGGVFVASGNVDGLVGDEVIVAPDRGGGPHVKVFNLLGDTIGQFMAYDPAFTGGVRVATSDVDGDGVAEIITAPGAGGGPHVKVFRLDGTLVGQFMAYAPSFTPGVYVGGAPGGRIVTGPGQSGGPHVRVVNAGGGVVGEFLTPPTDNRSGVRVAGGQFNGSGGGEPAITFGPGAQSIVRLTAVNGELLLP